MKEINMYVENNFRTRLVDVQDNAFLLSLRNDKDVINAVNSFRFLNETTQEAWIKSTMLDSHSLYLVLEKNEENVWLQIGLIKITQLDHVNKSMNVGVDLLSAFRGNGYSRIAYDMIFNLAFNQYNMNKVWLTVLETNTLAIQIYEKLGFKKQGIMRDEVFKNGSYINSIYMDILKSEYIHILGGA